MVLIEKAVKVDKELLHGDIRLTSFTVADKSNGGKYAKGTVTVKGGETLSYNIWDEQLIDLVRQVVDKYGLGVYLKVEAEGNIYKSNFNVSLRKIVFEDQSKYRISDYYDIDLDSGELISKINAILHRNTTTKAIKLVSSVLKGSVAERFSLEFAGQRMHDATPIGLLHHTVKMLEITELVMKQHNNFELSQEDVDLMYVGVLLHDIGKIEELNDGVYTPISVVSHRILGIHLVDKCKDLMLESYDEMWYYNLLAILTQHHGEYEERPRTVFSYLVHLVDMFETSMTIVHEKMVSEPNGSTINLSGFKLKVQKG